MTTRENGFRAKIAELSGEVSVARMQAKKKRKWDQEQMNLAYKLVIVDHWDIAVAAKHCQVPRRTLGDRVNGRVPVATPNGRPSALKEEEEKELVKWCDRMNDMGFEVSRAEIEDVVKKWKPELKYSDGWWDRFRKRHPELVLRKTQKMDRIERLEQQEEERKKALKEKEEKKEERKRKREEKDAKEQEKKRQKIEQNRHELPIIQLIIQKRYMEDGGALTISIIKSFTKANNLGCLGKTRAEMVSSLLQILEREKERAWA